MLCITSGSTFCVQSVMFSISIGIHERPSVCLLAFPRWYLIPCWSCLPSLCFFQIVQHILNMDLLWKVNPYLSIIVTASDTLFLHTDWRMTTPVILGVVILQLQVWSHTSAPFRGWSIAYWDCILHTLWFSPYLTSPPNIPVSLWSGLGTEMHVFLTGVRSFSLVFSWKDRMAPTSYSSLAKACFSSKSRLTFSCCTGRRWSRDTRGSQLSSKSLLFFLLSMFSLFVLLSLH